MAHVSFPNGFERLPKRLVYDQVNVQRRTFQIAKIRRSQLQNDSTIHFKRKQGELMLHVNIHRSLILKKNFSSNFTHSNGQTVYVGSL